MHIEAGACACLYADDYTNSQALTAAAGNAYYCVLQVRYPPLPLNWTLHLSAQPVHHIHSSQDSFGGALAGISVGSMLRHAILASELLSDYSRPSWKGHTGVCLSMHCYSVRHTVSSCRCCIGHGEQQTCRCADEHADSNMPRANQCCGAFSAGLQHVTDSCTVSDLTGKAAALDEGMNSSCRCETALVSAAATNPAADVSPAAAAAMQACSKLVPELRWTVVHVHLDNYQVGQDHVRRSGTACSSYLHCSRCRGPDTRSCASREQKCRSSQEGEGLQEVLLDDEWTALEEASVILLDAPEQQAPATGTLQHLCSLTGGQQSPFTPCVDLNNIMETEPCLRGTCASNDVSK